MGKNNADASHTIPRSTRVIIWLMFVYSNKLILFSANVTYSELDMAASIENIVTQQSTISCYGSFQSLSLRMVEIISSYYWENYLSFVQWCGRRSDVLYRQRPHPRPSLMTHHPPGGWPAAGLWSDQWQRLKGSRDKLLSPTTGCGLEVARHRVLW